jgi:hypothetical protein
MHAAHHATSHRLQRGQSLRLRRPRRLCLRATEGTLWITVDGETDDIVLSRGEHRTFDATAPVLVTAMSDAAALTVLSLSRPPTWRERLAASFGRLATAAGA